MTLIPGQSVTKVGLELLRQLKRQKKVQTCPDNKSKVAVVLDGYLSFLFTRCRFLISSFNLSQFFYSGIISGISNDITDYLILCFARSNPMHCIWDNLVKEIPAGFILVDI